MTLLAGNTFSPSIVRRRNAGGTIHTIDGLG